MVSFPSPPKNLSDPEVEPLPDPLSYAGPVQLDQMVRNTDKTDMRQLQLQLECEAQREAVQKYQQLADKPDPARIMLR